MMDWIVFLICCLFKFDMLLDKLKELFVFEVVFLIYSFLGFFFVLVYNECNGV